MLDADGTRDLSVTHTRKKQAHSARSAAKAMSEKDQKNSKFCKDQALLQSVDRVSKAPYPGCSLQRLVSSVPASQPSKCMHKNPNHKLEYHKMALPQSCFCLRRSAFILIILRIVLHRRTPAPPLGSIRHHRRRTTPLLEPLQRCPQRLALDPRSLQFLLVVP